MRIAKIGALLLLAAGAAYSARQLAGGGRPPAPLVAPVARSGLKVVSTVPRHKVGVYDLQAVALVGEEEAWAVGYDEEHTRRAYHSVDGGSTWSAVDLPGNGSPLTSLSFPDARHGWAVGGDGLIVRTKDGGASWDLLKPPTESDLEAVHFIDRRVGLVGGKTALLDSATDEVTGFTEILCTEDGGETWRRCYKQDEPSGFFQLTSLSESVWFAVLGANQLVRTEDRGKTWAEVPKPAQYVYSVAQARDGTSWLACARGLLSSTDGGRTWGRPPSLPEGIGSKNWKAITFDRGGRGVAVGEAGAVAVTSDGGTSWELTSLAASEELRAISLYDSSVLILGAKDAYRVKLSP